MKKQVCVKIERYYDIEAETQEELEKKLRTSTERIARRFMSNEDKCAYRDYFYPSANCAFVTSEVVNEENTTHKVVACIQK